jgi:hypothetical protein
MAIRKNVATSAKYFHSTRLSVLVETMVSKRVEDFFGSRLQLKRKKKVRTSRHYRSGNDELKSQRPE